MDVFLASLAPLLLAFSPLGAGDGPCMRWHQEARYRGYGYDHLVTLVSHCERSVACEVSTDVAPSAVTVAVAPGATETVLTFRGSPAREFTASVVCAPAP